jgi:hypothetical protein
LNVLAGQNLTQLEEKAAAAAAALKAVTGKEEKPVTTTTTTTKTTTTVETVVVSTGDTTETVVPAPTPNAVDDAKPKKDDDDVGLNPDSPDNAAVPAKKGMSDPVERGSIFLGLRVYTNRDAHAVIGGQLRHEMNTSFAGLALAGV